MDIVYIGQFNDASGYGNAAREYLKILDKHLDKTKFNLNLVSMRYESTNSASSEENILINKYLIKDKQLFFASKKPYILIHHLLPNLMLDIFKDNNLNIFFQNAYKKISMIAWETDKLPKLWLEIYNSKRFDSIITFCESSKEAINKDINLPCEVLPHYIQVDNIKNKKFNDDKFRIFSMSQWNQRKGYDILIKCFYNTFFNNEDVELVIKTYKNEMLNGAIADKEREEIFNDALLYKKAVTNYGLLPKCKLKIIPGYLSKNEVTKLYNECDVYCSTTRGEGFGLTIAEAALHGMPLIVPDKGGHIDYLNTSNNFLFKTFLQPSFDMNSIFYSSLEMNHYEPLMSSVCEKMLEAYTTWKYNKDKLDKISKNNSLHTSSLLNDKQIFSKFINIIERNL